MNENSFVDHENGNPNYKEDQRNILDSIKAEPSDEVLPPELYDVIKNNLGKMGETVIEQDNGQKLILDKSENNILTIKRISSLNEEMGLVTEKDDPMALKIAAKLMPKMDRIQDYFMVDLESGMAFDASVLWKTKSSTKYDDRDGDTTAMMLPKKKEVAAFRPDSGGGEMIINEMDDKIPTVKRMRRELSSDQVNLVEKAMLFHETGHKFQYDQYADGANRSAKLLILAAMHKGPFKKLYKPETVSKIEQMKSNVVGEERNATAFAFLAIRKLKESGLDLTRGLDNDQVTEAVSYGLVTYEKLLGGVNGPKFIKAKQ